MNATQHDGDVDALTRENARRLANFERHGGFIKGICFECLGPIVDGHKHTCREDRLGGLARVRREHARAMR